jgi:ribosomal protein RSM22 (predicted rRNA methylase)
VHVEHRDLDLAIEAPGAKGWPDVLLVSHVLDELSHAELADLLALARHSRAVIWVEAGSRATSRRLSQVRDELQAELDVLAPCTHQARCGVLAAGRETSWCHHFARPPAEVFTSAFWREFSSQLGLDLRSVPFSFAVLARRGEPLQPDGARARILGAPRVLKGRALVEVCDESGVRDVALLQRTDRELFKRLERRLHDPLLGELELDDQRVTAIRELPSAPPAQPE